LSHVVRLLDFVESRDQWLLAVFVDLICSRALFLGHEWQHCSNLVVYLIKWVNMLKFNRVTLSIGRFQVAWTAIANKSSVDHDSDGVAQ